MQTVEGTWVEHVLVVETSEEIEVHGRILRDGWEIEFGESREVHGSAIVSLLVRCVESGFRSGVDGNQEWKMPFVSLYEPSQQIPRALRAKVLFWNIAQCLNACLGCTTGGIAECLLLGTPDCVGGRRLYCSCGEQRRALRFPDVVLQLGLPSVVVLVRANPLSWSTDHELRRAPRRTKWGGICHMVCNALGKPHIASWPQFLGGLADPAMNLQLPGTVGCVLKAVQTSTSIVTTTSSASTLATTLTRTLTTTSTSYSFDRTIQSTSSRADQPSSTTLTPQPTSMTSPEAAMGKGQVTVSTAQSPTPVSKLATSSGPPSVMTGSGTFGTSIGTITTSTGTGTTSTRTDISSMIPYANQRTSTLSTRSDAPSYFGDEYRHRGQGLPPFSR
ncbi:hypothetical protein PG993_014232 [Apiospora rasikravindrae]|uniref:Uncharacterized protein n=1 Tax=Apiospora rasikravindrae TaxID=990691 RepID=A0ABR1RM77_9PEZI